MALALAQVAAIEPIRRRRQAHDPQIGHQLAQRRDRGAIHALIAMWNEMRFIDDDQLARADRFRVAIDRIDGGKQNLRVGVARAQVLRS